TASRAGRMGLPPAGTIAARSRGVLALLPVDGRQAELQPERLEETVQRLLRGVVPRTDRPQDVRPGHADLLAELLHADRADDLAERLLQGAAVVDRREEKLAGKLRV